MPIGYPKVSIICLVYNQANYIKECLESIFSQRISCSYEIIIHDDFSTDGSREIIEEFYHRHPQNVVRIYQEKNKLGDGHDVCAEYVFPRVRGQYVTICDGDDYWLDIDKVQRQVDYLDAHPDCSLVYHPVYELMQQTGQLRTSFPHPDSWYCKRNMTFNRLLKSNFLQTNGVMYRWCLRGRNLLDYPTGILPSDWMWHLLHARIGNIGFIPIRMAVYRRNETGIWTGGFRDESWYIKWGYRSLLFHLEVKRRFGYVNNREVKRLGLAVAGVLLDAADAKHQAEGLEIIRCLKVASITILGSRLWCCVYWIMWVVFSSERVRIGRRLSIWRIIDRHRRVLMRNLGTEMEEF